MIALAMLFALVISLGPERSTGHTLCAACQSPDEERGKVVEVGLNCFLEVPISLLLILLRRCVV